MINEENIQISEDKVSQYLRETREYIERLKNDLLKKILLLQQNKKTGIDSIEFPRSANANLE